MIGSLYRVWPFQVDTTPNVEEFKLKAFEPAWPEALDGVAITCAVIAVVCFVLVLAVDVHHHVAIKTAGVGLVGEVREQVAV